MRSGNQSRMILLLGIISVALSLRPAIASVSPILETIRADLKLSYTAVSLLTTIPTLCMGVFALTVPIVTERLGRERGVYWGVILITAATAIRITSQYEIVLFGSTILVGIGIAVTQALLPSLVTTYFADRASFATGLYTASLMIGAALSGAFTVPVAEWLSSWPAALAIWALPAGIAIPLWFASWKYVGIQRDTTKTVSAYARIPLKDPWAWFLTLFFGGSSSMFFLILTWLAPRYMALGWTEGQAGLLLSAFLLLQLAGSLVISAVGDRLTDHRPLFALMLILVIIGSTSIAIIPQQFPLIWIALLGIGTAGLFTLGLTLPIKYTANPTATDGLSSMMLGGGYPIAALGPFVAGIIQDLTETYSIVFGSLSVLAITLLCATILFDPDREVVPNADNDVTVES